MIDRGTRKKGQGTSRKFFSDTNGDPEKRKTAHAEREDHLVFPKTTRQFAWGEERKPRGACTNETRKVADKVLGDGTGPGVLEEEEKKNLHFQQQNPPYWALTRGRPVFTRETVPV